MDINGYKPSTVHFVRTTHSLNHTLFPVLSDAQLVSTAASLITASNELSPSSSIQREAYHCIYTIAPKWVTVENRLQHIMGSRSALFKYKLHANTLDEIYNTRLSTSWTYFHLQKVAYLNQRGKVRLPIYRKDHSYFVHRYRIDYLRLFYTIITKTTSATDFILELSHPILLKH